MRQIELVGPVDKRPIAYPLFKICDTLGKVLVITDDCNFRRFAPNFEKEFTVGRSDFIITQDVSVDIIENMRSKFSTYDYVIIISINNIIENNDVLVYCHGDSNLICTEDTLDRLEDFEHQDVTISTHKPADKKALYLGVDGKTFSYVWSCEENKMFVPCSSSDLIKLGSFLFGQILNVSKVEEYSELMKKEMY